MSAPFRITVRGRSGHASMPGIADNALVKAARLVERIAGYEPPREIQQEVAAFLRVLDTDLDGLPQVAREMVEPLLAPTFSPTMIAASQKRNVIPAVCEVTVDCRLLPGTTPADVEPTIRAVLGDGEYDIEFTEAQGGTRSALDTPLWRAVESFVAEAEPGSKAVPICTAGFTDSHWLREAFGTVAYGFFPARAMPTEVRDALIHSADERVPIDDLELGVDFLRHTARAICG
jgi:acetylornithine deacetylase/succinyl-diaminopimelate desuccinylase-like protein